MGNATLAEALFRHAIGFDRLARLTDVNASFPPHNIEKLDEDRYVLTLAVAGFGKEDISITTQKGTLRIEGKRQAGEAVERAETTILYQGIAFRDFVREFRLGEDVEVENATLEHGLLEITLNRIVPEQEKPRFISVS